MGGLATANALANLAGNVNDLSGNVADLATADDLTTGLADLQTQIDALVDALDNVADADDITAITEQLNQVQEDLDELLAANRVINQNITITNVATLEYVESIISTDTSDPNVIVNGTITVSVDEDDFDAAQLARVNAVIGKIATSLSTVTITNTYSSSTELNFANLGFIDRGLTINGQTNLADDDSGNDVLRTISGDLTITNYSGDLNLNSFTRANNVTVPTNLNSLLLGSLNAQSISTTGSGTGELQLLTATVIDVGTASVQNLNAPELNVSGVVSATSATAITIEDVDTGCQIGATDAESLTIRLLEDTNSFENMGTGFDFGSLKNLNVTGVADSAPSISSQTNAVSSTSAVLENVTVAGTIDFVAIYTGTELESVSTDGYIRWFELRNGGSDLSAITVGHDHIEGSDAATFIVSDNSDLTGITTTALDEVVNITIENNPDLSTLDLSSFDTLPILGAYTITISNTALTGNYVEATFTVTTTGGRDERIRSATLNSLKSAMTLAAATTAVTYTFAGDIISNVTTSTRQQW